MPNPVLSFKLLACCWGGVALLAGSGAVALQLSGPAAAPVAVAPPAVEAAAVVAAAPMVTATPLPATTPMPFRNSSLLALLSPALERPADRAPDRAPERMAERAVRPAAVAPALPLPLPPIPPPPVIHRVVRVEPRRPAPVYAAEPQPNYPNWGRPMPYPGQFASARQFQYGPPPTYYGWQPY